MLGTDSANSNLSSTLVLVRDVVVGYLEPGPRCECNTELHKHCVTLILAQLATKINLFCCFAFHWQIEIAVSQCQI